MSEKQSSFRFYSVGVVTETKPVGTDFIMVSPMEELSIQGSGMIADQEDDFSGSKGGNSSPHFTTQHTSKNYVRAKWYSLGQGNRTSAPDVVAGETVILFKYGNVDEYFWDEIGREPALRRLENVLYSFSNVPGGIGSEAYDKDTSYWVEVNTKEKFVHIHTADNDGEACTFDIRIDTGAGVLRIEDGLGNFMNWDAVAGVQETVFNTEIIRRAPTITEESDKHHIQTTTYLNEASGSTTNDTPIVTNTGDLDTAGNEKVGGDIQTGAIASVNNHTHTTTVSGRPTSEPNG